MDLTLSFAEYSAVNRLKNLSSATFSLLVTASLGKIGNNRTWILRGDKGAFEALRADLTAARERVTGSATKAALSDVASGVEDLLGTQLPALQLASYC